MQAHVVGEKSNELNFVVRNCKVESNFKTSINCNRIWYAQTSSDDQKVSSIMNTAVIPLCPPPTPGPCVVQDVLYSRLVQITVGLRPGTAYRRALAAVKLSKVSGAAPSVCDRKQHVCACEAMSCGVICLRLPATSLCLSTWRRVTAWSQDTILHI